MVGIAASIGASVCGCACLFYRRAGREMEKIAILNSPIEAQLLEGILTERDIPHVTRSYLDSAYDGVFQTTRGWGHVEAPADRREEIIEILEDLRAQPPEPAGE